MHDEPKRHTLMPLGKCILLAINTVIKLHGTFEDENCYRKKKQGKGDGEVCRSFSEMAL